MRVLREPLLHFAVLGVGVFGLYRLLSPEQKPADEIVVDSARVEALAEQFSRTSQRAPTAAELDGLVDDYVRDEVLYRAGRALGLDRDDPVIRKRIRARMETLGESVVQSVSDQDLEDWLHAHASRYAAPTRYDFRQAFFAPERRGASLDADVAAALRHASAGAGADAVAALGDATLLPADLQGASREDVAAQFGDEFAATLDSAPLGEWLGPVGSVYGTHVVLVTAREPGPAATLDTARQAVERDVRDARASAAREESYARLRSRYTVRVEHPPAQADGARAALAAQP